LSDVLIVGGGIAGSSLAMMLGRKGLAVRVFEKAKFPREKPCGDHVPAVKAPAIEVGDDPEFSCWDDVSV